MFPESGILEVVTLPITGEPIFDFFFTLCLVNGLILWVIGGVCHVLTRS